MSMVILVDLGNGRNVGCEIFEELDFESGEVAFVTGDELAEAIKRLTDLRDQARIEQAVQDVLAERGFDAEPSHADYGLPEGFEEFYPLYTELAEGDQIFFAAGTGTDPDHVPEWDGFVGTATVRLKDGANYATYVDGALPEGCGRSVDVHVSEILGYKRAKRWVPCTPELFKALKVGDKVRVDLSGHNGHDPFCGETSVLFVETGGTVSVDVKRHDKGWWLDAHFGDGFGGQIAEVLV